MIRTMKPIEKERKKLVKVIWCDSGGTIDLNVWYTCEELIEEAVEHTQLVETVGFVIAENKDFILLTSSSDGNLFRGGFQILKKCIEKIEVLQEVDIEQELVEKEERIAKRKNKEERNKKAIKRKINKNKKTKKK